MVLDWIESLGGNAYECIEPLPDGGANDPAIEMVKLIARHASLAKTAHDGITLTTQGGEQRPLAALFDQPSVLMGALVASGWITPGQPQRSFFLTRILQEGGPMQGIFSGAEVSVVSDWIKAGAQLPTQQAFMIAGAGEALGDAGGRARREFAMKRPYIGMGSVH